MNVSSEERHVNYRRYFEKFEEFFNLDAATLISAEEKIKKLKAEKEKLEQAVNAYKIMHDNIVIAEKNIKNSRVRGHARGRGPYRRY